MRRVSALPPAGPRPLLLTARTLPLLTLLLLSSNSGGGYWESSCISAGYGDGGVLGVQTVAAAVDREHAFIGYSETKACVDNNSNCASWAQQGQISRLTYETTYEFSRRYA